MTIARPHVQHRERPAPPAEAPEIVVGVDGRDATLPAVRWAAAEARRRGARLVLATVDHWGGDTMPSATERAGTQARLLVMAELCNAPAPPVAVTVEVLEGLPGPALVQRAADALLLVVGVPASGPGGTRPCAVPSYCYSHARCPTVVVPAGDLRP